MKNGLPKAAQAELFVAETTWFHIFRTMIANGDMAKMRPNAFAVYCVIKAHTNFSTGHAFPRIELIAEKSGMSVAQVKRELITLEKMEYLTKEKKGRSNHYLLREKIELKDKEGMSQALASWDYVPSGVQAAIADLKNVILTGDVGGARIVQIERLTVNVNASTGTQINIDLSNTDLSSMSDGDLKRQLQTFLANQQANKPK